ncbi:ester hydrolase C11orf54 homolog [Rhynchophorus ferrugineus]|uniref:ester hydrolase C11orf54 homolog n=1 Tax=Rhynchophorus ferrugineus TaxID=354439 RepID=UPI003FCC358C
MAVDFKNIRIEKRPLFVPSLDEIGHIFRTSLQNNYAEVSVEMVDAPDLTQEPFLLANKGLNGNPKLVEVGGTPYLLPLPKPEKIYDLRDIARATNLEPAFFIGAGAGPHNYVGVNCEGIFNCNITDGILNQKSVISKVHGDDESIAVQFLSNDATDIGILGNIFASEGKPGKVLEIRVKKRLGSKNFIECLRNALETNYGNNRLVGLGGVFLLQEGRAHQHIMRKFPDQPITDEEGVNNWLKFYEMSAPLIALGTFTSGDGGDLDLRGQHFHSFSTHGEAGHYHNDTTPDEAEYLGYFNLAKELIRIDQPVETHNLGKV